MLEEVLARLEEVLAGLEEVLAGLEEVLGRAEEVLGRARRGAWETLVPVLGRSGEFCEVFFCFFFSSSWSRRGA